jgi:hypothetical protein
LVRSIQQTKSTEEVRTQNIGEEEKGSGYEPGLTVSNKEIWHRHVPKSSSPSKSNYKAGSWRARARCAMCNGRFQIIFIYHENCGAREQVTRGD